MAPANQTGIFYANAPAMPVGTFPSEYRKRMLSGVDRRFTILFAGLMLAFGTLVGILSFVKPSTVVSEKDVLKMQARYAQLVLNEPKPQPKVEAVKAERAVEGTATETSKEEVKVDRAKETFVEKEKRREASVEQRKATREAISKKISSAGIFAAITATKGRGGMGGGGSGPGGMSDLLGAADGVSSLDGISVSKGTFATRNVSTEELKARKAGGGGAGGGEVDVGIEARKVGRAQVAQIASNAAVSITSEPAEVKGDEGQVSTSKACIQRVITRESTRIKRVFEDWLKRDPQLGGRIKVKFTIMPGGSVSNVSVAQSTTNNEAFDQNIVRYIQRWDFSSCSPTSPLEIEFPFAFEGQS